MCKDAEIALAEYNLLCLLISRGGRPDLNRLHKAGLEAEFPAEIGVLSPDYKTCPALTLLAEATQFSNCISFSAPMGEPTIIVGGVEYLVGPWYEAFVAINRWRKIITPHLKVEGDKPLDDQEVLDSLIAEIPYKYVGLDLGEVVNLAIKVGWNTNIQRISPIKPAHEADPVIANHARELLPLCLGEVEIIADDSIAIPYPMPSTPYRFEDLRFMQIIRALIQRSENLQPIN